MTVSFPAHVALLNELLTRHQAVVEQIESRLLNVQGKDPSRNRSRGPCTVIETLFVERDHDGSVRRSAMGSLHEHMVRRYRQLVIAAAQRLREDARSLDPAPGPYSSLGITCGFSRTFFPAWSWQRCSIRLPGSEPRGRVRDERQSRDRAPFRVLTRTPGSLVEKVPDGTVPAQEHCLSSDVNRALVDGATAFPRSQIVGDRNEGRFLASAEIDGKWFAVSKTIVTQVIGQGFDALILDVPEPVIDVLRVTCPDLIVVGGN